jgi:hypothetical protein
VEENSWVARQVEEVMEPCRAASLASIETSSPAHATELEPPVTFFSSVYADTRKLSPR